MQHATSNSIPRTVEKTQGTNTFVKDVRIMTFHLFYKKIEKKEKGREKEKETKQYKTIC